MDPLESGNDVEHSDIAGVEIFLTSYGGEIGIAERIQAMIDRAEDHVAVFRKILSAIAILLDSIAAGEAAAVQPDYDRTLSGIQFRRPDVQAKAILAYKVIVPSVHEEGR